MLGYRRRDQSRGENASRKTNYGISEEMSAVMKRNLEGE